MNAQGFLSGFLKGKNGKKIVIGLVLAVTVGIVIAGIVVFLGAYKIVHFVTLIQENWLYKKLVPQITATYIAKYPEKVEPKVALKYGVIPKARAADGATKTEEEIQEAARKIVRREVVFDLNSKLSGGAVDKAKITDLVENYDQAKSLFIEGIDKGWISFSKNKSEDLVITFGAKDSNQKSKITLSAKLEFASKILANLDPYNPKNAFEKEITAEMWESLGPNRDNLAQFLLSYRGGTPGFIANFILLASTKLKTWLKVLGIKGNDQGICSADKSGPGAGEDDHLLVRAEVFDMGSIENLLEQALTAFVNFFRNLFGLGCSDSREIYAKGGQWFITADKIKRGELSSKIAGEFTTKFWEGVEESAKYQELVRNNPNPSLLDRYYVFMGSLKSNFRALAQDSTTISPGDQTFNEVVEATDTIYQDLSYMTANFGDYADEINNGGVGLELYTDYVKPYDANESTVPSDGGGGGGGDGGGGIIPPPATGGTVLEFQKYLADYTGQRATITSDCFDPRPGGRLHMGYDFGLTRGTTVPAVYSGTVVQIISNWGDSGDALWIQNDDKSYVYSYGHINILSSITRGTHVDAGTPIGTIYKNHLDVKKFTDPNQSYTKTVICEDEGAW